MDYYCVDIESSGPVPGIHNLLSVGITHVRRYQGSYQPFEDIYVELEPTYEGFEEAAMRVNGLDVERLRSEGLPPAVAMQRLVDFVAAQRTKKKERPVFVAHNCPFDWMFFVYYCGHTQVKNPFGYSALDTKALAMGKLGLAWNQTSLKSVRERLGVPPLPPDQMHHAGADAQDLGRVFSALMNRAAG